MCAKHGSYFNVQRSNMTYHIRSTQITDLSAIRAMYLAVAERGGGIIRRPYEITDTYVTGFFEKAKRDNGYSLVAEDPDGSIIGEIHAYGYGLAAHAHILTDLTVSVHPDAQGRGIGKGLFLHLLGIIEAERPDILRVELWVREQNKAAIGLYESVGFVQEGRFPRMILNADGSFDTPIQMAWENPRYEVLGSHKS
jgi:ribosomal protein S18 acetylase RimI-like enzyme